jgi:hypothetical protein
MNVNMKVLFWQTLKLGKKKKLIKQMEILSFTHNGGQTCYTLITNVTMFWMDKGLHIWPSSMKEQRHVHIIHFAHQKSNMM